MAIVTNEILNSKLFQTKLTFAIIYSAPYATEKGWIEQLIDKNGAGYLLRIVCNIGLNMYLYVVLLDFLATYRVRTVTHL